MSSGLFYLLTRLPALPALGGVMPVSWEDLEHLTAQESDPVLPQLVRAITMEHFLDKAFHAKFLLCEEIATTRFPPTIQLAMEQETGEKEWVETLWKTYFDWLESGARSWGATLLSEWASWEYRLREALQAARESRVPDEDDSEIRQALQLWQSAKDPIAGEKSLDEVRWNFIESRIPHFSFALEEFVGYLLKLRLLDRYSHMETKIGETLLKEVTAL